MSCLLASGSGAVAGRSSASNEWRRLAAGGGSSEISAKKLATDRPST